MPPPPPPFPRGLAPKLAKQFGVHRTTIWRDLQFILYGPCECHVNNQYGEPLYTVYREYRGGPIVGMIDVDGNEIRGPERKRILRQLPRYTSRRRR